MEERKNFGLEVLSSSEQCMTRGGAGVDIMKIVEIIRGFIDSISNYIPSFIKGLKDGKAGKNESK
ncbi:MAG: hypothetical protein HUJ93_01665 [Bacteroidales bacterium]|mgnify:CR=1 FL=1|nr:hypothetical protein [Bacteroidales bacterium]